jgi:uncharacterized protein (DUF2384 family)
MDFREGQKMPGEPNNPSAAGVDDESFALRLLSEIPRFRALTTAHRQRLPELARLAALARHVWEDDDAAREFLISSQPQLGGRSPLDLAMDGADVRPVEQLLNQIEYSLPA